jgi:hypothetical protein
LELFLNLLFIVVIKSLGIWVRNESGKETSTTLGGTGVTSQALFPSATNNQNIKAMRVTFKVFATQTTATSFKASDVFGGWKLVKGADTRFHVTSFAELEKFYNMLSRRDFSGMCIKDGDAEADPVTGQMEATLEIVMPLQYRTDVVPVSTFTFNPLSDISATSGNVSTSIKYFYTEEKVQDDRLQIKKIPVTLQHNVDADISQYLPTEYIDELWLDVTTNETLNNMSYVLGSDPIYSYDLFDLTLFTVQHEFLTQVAGFFQLRVPPQTWQLSATVGTKPKLNVNLTTPMQPVIYMYQKV